MRSRCLGRDSYCDLTIRLLYIRWYSYDCGFGQNWRAEVERADSPGLPTNQPLNGTLLSYSRSKSESLTFLPWSSIMASRAAGQHSTSIKMSASSWSGDCLATVRKNQPRSPPSS